MAKKIEKEKKQENNKRTLDDPQTKSEIINLEMKIKDCVGKNSYNDISYYGHIINPIKFPGYVVNELLGGVHWSVVQYGITNGFIIKKNDIWHYVLGSGFNKFIEDIDLLESMLAIRRYAEKQTVDNSQEKLI